jgi:symplekin
MGFIHCVKAIAPASFGALMQLPREQLKELIDKQPSIKPALYQYVVQKAGVAKAQSLADVSVERFRSLQPFES